MRNLFPQHYRPTDNDFTELFNDCVFVFDANMLLNLYRYPRKAREDLFSILRSISGQGRLWLPFQAALEFQENRLVVIADQKRKFGQVKKVIADIQAELQKKLDELQLRRRHSSIDPDALIKEINSAFNKYTAQLNAREAEQLDILQEDKIRSEIDKLFDGHVGKSFSQPELDAIFNAGGSRYKPSNLPAMLMRRKRRDYLPFTKNLLSRENSGI
jgi:PIN domain-containing protein